MIKNFSAPQYQNMVRADIFTGSLAVFRFAAKPHELVALDCSLMHEELLRASLHLAFPRIGIRGVNLGEDGERELFENPLATALIDPSVMVRRAPPHLANFHGRALRLLASLPLGLRAAEEIVNAIVVGCGEDAAHHDIEVAVSANEDEAHACFSCLLANARALFSSTKSESKMMLPPCFTISIAAFSAMARECS